MSKIVIAIFALLLCIAEAKTPVSVERQKSVSWPVPAKRLPLPSCASKEVQKVLAQIKPPNLEARRTFSPKNKEAWKEWVSYAEESGSEGAKAWAAQYGVSIRPKKIAGIDVFYLTPESTAPEHTRHLFVYLHGGAYIFGGGMSGLNEAVLIASRTKIPVIAVDYRMPPDHPYPAPIEDVVRVYSSLLKAHPAGTIAMGGSSSGGGLTLAVVQKLKAEGTALPGALFVGTPWSDLSKCGDSLFVNEGIDRKIVTYDGFVAAAAKLYAGGHDLKEPGLSPVYGDFSGFPPSMLVTGTRDLFLSLTVRVHRKMKAAGVTADLNVYEGLSHVEYFVIPDAPESLDTYRQLDLFLKQYLK